MFWKVSFVFCLRPAPPIAATYIDPIPKGVQGAQRWQSVCNQLFVSLNSTIESGKASVKNVFC